TEMQFRPGLERAAPLNQLSIAFRKLPASVDASPGIRACKCQSVDGAGLCLEVVKGGHRLDRIAKRPVGRHVGDTCAIDIDVPPIVQAVNMILPGLYRIHFPSISTRLLAAVGATSRTSLHGRKS